jgi:ankyrin repeat protein
MTNAPVVNLHSLAQGLLDTIEVATQEGILGTKSRVIFVAHSHGGLVVKEALVSDSLDKDFVSSRTDGVLFLGTPHQGSALSGFALVAAFGLGAWGSEKGLLASLAPGSDALWEMNKKFAAVLEKRQKDNQNPVIIRNFYEEKKLTMVDFGLGIKLAALVVQRTSASLDLSNARNIPLNRDHKGLNKFDTRDTDYKKVLQAIKDCFGLKSPQLVVPWQSLYPEDVKAACIHSLGFSSMDSREHDINIAHPSTCEWLSTTSEFRQWISRENIDSHNGVLWIKGKAGAGKSTLMKHALAYCRDKLGDDCLIAAYFFNARGHALEKTPLGLFRSLVYQIIEKSPAALERFLPFYIDHEKKKNGDWSWTLGELRNFLLSEIENQCPIPKTDEHQLQRQSQNLFIFLDALDECDDAEARKIAQFLERLSTSAARNGFHLYICLSSRHYPTVGMKKKLDLIVENIPEHSQDITNYVSDTLAKKDQYIEGELIRKAAGVFMWVVLAVEFVNKAYDEGGSIADMKTELDQIPPELEAIYHRLFEVGKEDSKTVLIIQWTLFAKSPLMPEELYFAVLAGSQCNELQKWNLDEVDDDRMRRFITKFSKGLIEVRVSSSASPEFADFRTKRYVRFIHKTVFDFFMENKRLQMLDQSLLQNPVGTSHNRLQECCLAYFQFWQRDSAVPQPENAHATNETSIEESSGFNRTVHFQYPLLNYLSHAMFYHGEKANETGISQDILLERLRDDLFWNSYRRLQEVASWSPLLRIAPEDTPIYKIAEWNHLTLLKSMLSTGSDPNAKGGRCGNVLQAAAHLRNLRSVKLLVQAGADINAQGGLFGNALQAAAGCDRVLQFLLSTGADVNAQGGYYGNALQAAAQDGRELTLIRLIEAGADVNAQGGYYGNALQAAAKYSSESMLKLLIEAGADVNAQGGYYGNAFQAAAKYCSESTLILLIEAGADIQAKGGVYGNALIAAGDSSLQAYGKMKILVEAGVDVNTHFDDGTFANALEAAAQNINVTASVLRFLLDAGANVNAKGGYYGNALCACVKSGRTAEAKMRVLLEAGADVNAQDGPCDSALMGLILGKYRAIAEMKLLLDYGADVNAPSMDFGSALHAAATTAHAEEKVKLLLNAGADVNIEGGAYGFALQAAVVFSDNGDTVKLLIEAGANINSQGGLHGTALRAAIYERNESTVKLLLDAGADVNVTVGQMSSPLSLAQETGLETIVKMLLDAGADSKPSHGSPKPDV